jgi:hypothetical protein
MKKIFIILLLSFSLTANAVELQTIQLKPTLWEKISTCKWHISCYFQKNLGTTLSTITGTETVSYALKTTVNNNFTALNAGKIEVSTTTLPLITTLAGLTSANALTSAANLATVGTITTGVWNASTLTVSKGGTGSTTLSANQVLLGNGTTQLGVVAGFGTSGQFLTSNGTAAAPSWTTSAVDQGISYHWTANHIFDSANFTIASTTNATSTNLTVSGNLIVSGTMSGVASVASTSVWTSSGTWTKPAGAKKVLVQGWGAGGGGAGVVSGTNGTGGGGGGEYRETWLDASSLGAIETITIGTGGAAQVNTTANGNIGTNTTFGGWATSTGGTGGVQSTNGTGGNGGNLQGALNTLWGVGASAAVGGNGLYSAAGGGAANNSTAYVGGNSTYGGGGGGGASGGGEAAGGTSIYGGRGGAGTDDGTAGAGTAPGGGGGAGVFSGASGSSGAGGNGKMIVTTFF